MVRRHGAVRTDKEYSQIPQLFLKCFVLFDKLTFNIYTCFLVFIRLSLLMINYVIAHCQKALPRKCLTSLTSTYLSFTN